MEKKRLLIAGGSAKVADLLVIVLVQSQMVDSFA